MKRAVDWPYSSIHRDIRAGRLEAEGSGEVPAGEFGEQGGVLPHRFLCEVGCGLVGWNPTLLSIILVTRRAGAVDVAEGRAQV